MRDLDDAFLHDLADSVSRALADNGVGLLVHVTCSTGGVDVGVLPLDGRAPADVLLGTVAPPHWATLGVAVRGRAWPLDRPGGPSQPVESVVLVARDGRVVGRLRQDDTVTPEPPAGGVTLDCLQRALGLPTPPPDVPPSHLLAAMWLNAVIQAGRVGGGLAPFDVGWGELRQQAERSGWPERGLTAQHAAWLDDGSFARWVMSTVPPVPLLVAEMRRALRPGEARRCLRLLQQMGVDVAA